MYGGQYQQGPPQGQSYGGPPQVAPPWIAEFDNQSRKWYYVNQQTGERRWEHPQQQYQNGPPPQQQQQQQQYYNGPPNQQYGGQYPPANNQGQEKKGGHSGLGWGLAAGAAGLVGGALLMHEGHEVKEDLERDKYRMEERMDNGVNDAAYYAGQGVQDVEDIPQDVENGFDRFGNRVESGFDNTVDYVEDTPDRLAGDIGGAVGRVENFGDDIRDSYDDGRDDARNDDGGW